MRHNRKFTDEELIIEYNQGFTDKIMAKRLNVCQNAVWSRRTKLGLITKNQITSSRILNKKELIERYKKSNEIKVARTNFKIENSPIFKKRNLERYKKLNTSLNKHCQKCNKIIDNRSNMCRKCNNEISNSARRKEVKL